MENLLLKIGLWGLFVLKKLLLKVNMMNFLFSFLGILILLELIYHGKPYFCMEVFKFKLNLFVVVLNYNNKNNYLKWQVHILIL